MIWMSPSSFLVTRLGMSCKRVVSMQCGIYISTMFLIPQSCFRLTLSVVDSVRFNVCSQKQLYANLPLSF